MAAARKRRRKKKRSAPKFSKVAVTALLVSVAAFTVSMTVVYLRTGGIPDTLVTAFFTFAGGEAGFLSLIKYSDNKFSSTDTTTSETGTTDGTGNG